MTEQRTEPEQLKLLIEARYQLVPLHRWDAKAKCKRTGKMRERGKSPVHANWTTRPYRNDDQFDHMEAGNNVGVRLTARDLVIDVDPRNFPKGEDLATDNPFDRLCRDVGLDVDQYPRVSTGSGGLHVYMRKPSRMAVVDGLKDVPGVEFKTFGRQVVAPGSVHPTGGRYTWSSDPDDLWLGVPRAPKELLLRIRRPKPVATATGAGVGEHPPEEIAAILDRLDTEDFRDHERWLQLMMACHHASAGAAREEFVEWCGRDPLYASDGPEVSYRWDSLRRHGVGLGTLYMFMREAGAAHLIDRRPRYDFPDDLRQSDDAPFNAGVAP